MVRAVAGTEGAKRAMRMDWRGVVLAQEPLMMSIEPDPISRDAGRIARERFAPASGVRPGLGTCEK